MKLLFTLLIVYQIKHFVCDYLLQGKYMMGKFKPWPDFILPLAAHASVHSLFTLCIGLRIVTPWLAFALALFDGTVHFIVDRIKASPHLLGRFQALSKREYVELMNFYSKAPALWKKKTDEDFRSNTYFWFSLGLDQMAHHLTHYGIIYLMLGGGL